ncbi:putative transcriptional regulatory protein [Colletotrichum sp. SAR 10_86]|nr:putative transcriptional regulatory protein [Colletotrichum sp. SAR 10_75]KAI8224076.1 putative transcriptional regulatory protein [Colletotrichum sp. SAR 10_86]KAJ5003582.1 putative transcriptional regulatory protein [Colletotrichum sp. SAR 10_66]
MDPESRASPRRLSLTGRIGGSRDAAKTISACLTCRRKKVKCSGDKPCTYCSRRGLECCFPEPGKKRVYSVTRIQDLQERLARYESQGLGFSVIEGRDDETGRINADPPVQSPKRPRTSATVHTPTDNATQVNAASTLLGLALDQLTSPPSTNTISRGTASNLVESSPGSTIPADSTLSSSHNFGSRLQNLLEHPRLSGREPTPQPRPHAPSSQPLATKNHDDAPALPSEDEGRKLFESMSFFIGYTQHHIDTREFSDRLAFFYANLGDPSQTQMPWYLEMVLVFAIGKLFSGAFDGDDNEVGLPGEGMFRYVQGRLPSLSELFGLGKLGVEIHALAAVYLQNANRKEEAYLYSEKVHLNRLWWTVYMQERRLAAATGNPSGISDDVIEIEMPIDSPGFPPALPLRTNIKIARVTGRILSTIYGPGNHPEDSFVPSVQEIVQSLYWIAKEIPGDFSSKLFDIPSMEGDVSLRTSAYLHMMLYQAILLTIRPVMLHVSKLIFDDENGSGLSLGSSPLGRLSRTCSEAARRLLEVLLALRKGNMLTIFGFFDLDAIFSAAFIMILTLIIDSTPDDSQKLAPSPGLPDALEILDYLVARGNDFASQRAREVRRMRDHLSTFLDIPKNSPSEVRNRPPAVSGDASIVVSMDDEGGGQDAEARRLAFPGSTPKEGGGVVTPSGRTSQLGSRSLLDSSLWNDISYLWMQPAAGEDAQVAEPAAGLAELMPEDAYNCYSIYHNQDLTLTGQDLGDFGELERHILGFGG